MPKHMSEDIFQGYRGDALEILQKYKVRVWGQAKVETTRGTFEGTILPRAETADDKHIVMKIQTGYNIGLSTSTITNMIEIGYKKANYKIPERPFPVKEGLPRVKLFGTGGTIASRLDYRTGAVIPAFSPGELYGSVPELADICNLTTEKLFAVFSENMTPEEYKKLAIAIGEEIKNGIDGIVIGHGTDTLQHTSAALTFMVQNPPIPIVLVGSQRSSDRPSSDAALNLMQAMRTAAYSDIAEVIVCMSGTTSDEYRLLHKGTRVRKMHSSYRSTFRTIGDIPLAMVTDKGFNILNHNYKPRRKNDREVQILPYFDDRVSMIYYYPGMKADIIDNLIDKGYKGIVFVGTGLGHVNCQLFPAIKRAKEHNIAIYMTLQTLWGYVNMNVYNTGRDLQALGVIPLGNMLPEVAYIKLGWALGQTQDLAKVKEIMLTPINDEITDREPCNSYLLYQGEIPEIEKFLHQVYH